MPIPTAPARSAVRKAGSRIRAAAAGEHMEADVLDAALATVDDYRAQLTVPTSKVATGLRSMCNSVGVDAEVSQRIKRKVTIVDKLSREAGLDLSRMQDIGGCRVILQSQEDLRALQARIQARWHASIHRVSDYIEDPRESGYRALHVVVKRDGHLVEIQLRDPIMHAWAETVEAVSALTRVNYKRDGDSIVQRFMKLESDIAQDLEAGVSHTPELLDEVDTLRAQVLDYVRSAPVGEGEQP